MYWNYLSFSLLFAFPIAHAICFKANCLIFPQEFHYCCKSRKNVLKSSLKSEIVVCLLLLSRFETNSRSRRTPLLQFCTGQIPEDLKLKDFSSIQKELWPGLWQNSPTPFASLWGCRMPAGASCCQTSKHADHTLGSPPKVFFLQSRNLSEATSSQAVKIIFQRIMAAITNERCLRKCVLRLKGK